MDVDVFWSFAAFGFGYVLLVIVLFALKLNRGRVAPTEHGSPHPVDAIEFFWRPG